MIYSETINSVEGVAEYVNRWRRAAQAFELVLRTGGIPCDVCCNARYNPWSCDFARCTSDSYYPYFEFGGSDRVEMFLKRYVIPTLNLEHRMKNMYVPDTDW